MLTTKLWSACSQSNICQKSPATSYQTLFFVRSCLFLPTFFISYVCFWEAVLLIVDLLSCSLFCFYCCPCLCAVFVCILHLLRLTYFKTIVLNLFLDLRLPVHIWPWTRDENKANSGTYTVMLINMHCPWEIN